MQRAAMSLHDREGQRKYLNQKERLRFLEATRSRPNDARLFCQLLFYTGARIAEIHNLTTRSVDFSNKTVVLESLKKRRRGIYREIPLPSDILKRLEGLYRLLETQINLRHGSFFIFSAHGFPSCKKSYA